MEPMELDKIDYRRYYPLLLLFVSLAALSLFGVSYFVEVRIIVESPNYGDVSETIQLFWRSLLGGTTIGSFLIGVYTFINDDRNSDGPPTKVEIKGTGHDIDVYPSGPVGERDEEGKKDAVRESEDGASTATANESSDSESDGERAIN